MLRTILVLILLIPGRAALADWQFTKWGMSPDEVTKASDGQTTPVEDKSDNKSNYRILLEEPYSASGIAFNARFGFDNQHNRLVLVFLAAKNAEDCAQIGINLENRYGNNYKDDSFGVMVHRAWRDI